MLSRRRSLELVLQCTQIGGPLQHSISHGRGAYPKDLPKARDSASAYYSYADSALVATLPNHFKEQCELHPFCNCILATSESPR